MKIIILMSFKINHLSLKKNTSLKKKKIISFQFGQVFTTSTIAIRKHFFIEFINFIEHSQYKFRN